MDIDTLNNQAKKLPKEKKNKKTESILPGNFFFSQAFTVVSPSIPQVT